jgi:hypothetical protein
MKKEDCKVGEHYMLVVNGEKEKIKYLGADKCGHAKVKTRVITEYHPHECLRRIKPKREKRWFMNVWNRTLTSLAYSSAELAMSGIDMTDPDYIGTVEVREVRWVKRAGK